ncbi:DMT family transporter [Oricola sp.]|uniref:DMT family transporter n=1 Tax=Oricola sp. TaxID=1979950 RepID=UPI003BAC3487
MTNHQKGLLLAFCGALVLTFDIPVLRLAGGEIWPVQFIRYGLAFGAGLVIWGLAGLWQGRPVTLLPGRTGVAVAGLYGLGGIAFVAAVFNTNAANVVFILAFNGMFAAAIGWLLFGERPPIQTLLTMAVMIGAVGLIVGDGLGSGNLFGDIAALAASFLIANAITLSRASGRDMGFAPLMGGLLAVSLAAVMMVDAGELTAASVNAPWWLIVNGAILIPVSFWCLATAPKFIPAPEAAMFYLLETVLAPVWVWLLFDESPTPLALTGGAILIVALFAHSLWQLLREDGPPPHSYRTLFDEIDETPAQVAKRRLTV